LVLVAGLLTTLLLVWSAAELSGLLLAGSWPHISVLASVVELLRVLGGGTPAPGIPVAVFWLCLLLEVAGAGRLAVQLRRWRGRGRQRTWMPRPAAGEPAGAVSFETAYARAVRADHRAW
ncbi:MAG: hypothetical protein ACREQ5_18690, partial [Candidatus Dormibacteria bacterium]